MRPFEVFPTRGFIGSPNNRVVSREPPDGQRTGTTKFHAVHGYIIIYTVMTIGRFLFSSSEILDYFCPPPPVPPRVFIVTTRRTRTAALPEECRGGGSGGGGGGLSSPVRARSPGVERGGGVLRRNPAKTFPVRTTSGGRYDEIAGNGGRLTVGGRVCVGGPRWTAVLAGNRRAGRHDRLSGRAIAKSPFK